LPEFDQGHAHDENCAYCAVGHTDPHVYAPKLTTLDIDNPNAQ
jgi:hypothetical protein